jgi:hypothetical protein
MKQSEALDILKLGHNTFLTGSAGTGKTYSLNQFIEYLKMHEIKYAVTASTGIAATHIGGTTIHSWSGMGIKENLKKSDLEILQQNEHLYKRWNNTKVLIIDEISMLHRNFLDGLDQIGKTLRRNNLPFGGIQVIFCGDFFQLPPVVKNKPSSQPFSKGEGRTGSEVDLESQYVSEMPETLSIGEGASNSERERVYAFYSNAWKEAKPVICYLTENYRQEDNTLLNILNAIRENNEELYESLESLNETKENTLQNPVKLWTHNVDVDKINLEFYNKIEDEIEINFEMKMLGKERYLQNLKQSILAPEILKLKVGTKVMFVKNDKEGKYQNGTLGVVTKIQKGQYPEVELKNGKTIVVSEESWQINSDDGKLLAEIMQIPLRYAWAITIHKSQGMTLDEAEIDLTKGFGYGMGYVALSRVKSLSGLKLHGLNNQALQVSHEVLNFDKSLRERSEMATEKIKKYSKKELKEMQQKTRVKMGGRKEELKIEEIEEKRKIEKEKNDFNSFSQNKSTEEKTLELLLQGKNILEISNIRDISVDTIVSHFEEILKVENEANGKIVKNELEKYFEDILIAGFGSAKTRQKLKKNIPKIKKDLEAENKLKPALEKWQKDFPEINYQILKILKLL